MYDVLYSPYKEKAEIVQKILEKSDISKKTKGKQKRKKHVCVAIGAPAFMYDHTYSKRVWIDLVRLVILLVVS